MPRHCPETYAEAVSVFLTPEARCRHYLDWLVVGESLELQAELEPLLRHYGEETGPMPEDLRRKALHEAGDLLFGLLVADRILTGDERLGTTEVLRGLWRSGAPAGAWPAPRRELRELCAATSDYAGACGKEVREPHARARRRAERAAAAVRVAKAAARLLWTIGYSPADAAAANHAKLQDRAARGVICGDGSAR